jgi:hypothetical protein
VTTLPKALAEPVAPGCLTYRLRAVETLLDRLLGDRFVTLVLHTGPRVYPVGDRIGAAPLCAL